MLPKQLASVVALEALQAGSELDRQPPFEAPGRTGGSQAEGCGSVRERAPLERLDQVRESWEGAGYQAPELPDANLGDPGPAEGLVH